MKRSRDSQPGRSIAGALVAAVAIGILTTISWLVYQHTKTNAAAAQQLTYTSTAGGFSFTYPSDWKVTEGPAGVDDEVVIVPSDASVSPANQFLMTLLVAGNPDVSDPPTAIPNGTVHKLSNGINLWVTTTASATRPSASAGRTICPELEITNANETHFSYALPNGQNLALIAGYCQGQNSTASLTYQQQLVNQDWQTAAAIIQSLQFN